MAHRSENQAGIVPRARRSFIKESLLLCLAGVATTRRTLLVAQSSPEQRRVKLPLTIAGVKVPDSPVAVQALQLAYDAAPSFLFNHSMRTFVFGGLLAAHRNIKYDDELMFVAGMLHDFGLLKAYASKNSPFEVDGADFAKAFLLKRGVSEEKAEMVWRAIAFHDSRLLNHQSPEITLTGKGAGVDFYGPEIFGLDSDKVKTVVKAFPRLNFKVSFPALLVDYCYRKPEAQVGTWTDSFCRAHTSGVTYPTIDGDLQKGPYLE